MWETHVLHINVVCSCMYVSLKLHVICTPQVFPTSKFSRESLRLATASAKDFEHTPLREHTETPVLGLRFVDSGRGTKYRLSMSERLRKARLHSDFLTSEGAESTAAVKQVYVPLRRSLSASVPQKGRVEKSLARPFRQNLRAANH